MGKTVLILGNGFDLAHDLPTRYSDFLKFCDTICAIKDSVKQEGNYKLEYYDTVTRKISKRNFLTEFMFKYYETLIHKEKNFQRHGNINFLEDIEYNQIDYFIENIYKCVNDNIWYRYLYQIFEEKRATGGNWIDFESEISFIIETIDKYVKNLSHNWYVVNDVNSELIDFPGKFKIFRNIVDSTFNRKTGTVRNVRKKLYNDLNDIIGALEVYLSKFVEKFIKSEKLDLIDQIMPDYIINFNYTHTYQNIYGGDVKPFHIHGELNHTPNNMVLGIDEYWSKKERDRHTNFTIFKKFAQRIQKRTGRDYFEIYNKLKQSNEQVKVYFFGHSLDVTDKDVLKMFLKDDSFNVTVYCVNEEAEGEYIASIIKIIGEKKLIYKVNQNPARLEFKLLNDERELSALGAAT